MKITDVRIRVIDREGRKVKGICSITIDDCFVVHDIKIIDSENGLFVAMPSKQSVEGEFRDIAHPINSETRMMIRETIINRYEQLLEEAE